MSINNKEDNVSEAGAFDPNDVQAFAEAFFKEDSVEESGEVQAAGEESEEEVSEDSEESEGLEASEPEAVEESVADEDVTPRANKRIRQLNAQKKELESQNSELKMLIEQMQKSNDLQLKAYERQENYFKAQELQSAGLRERSEMISQGLNPDDPRDKLTWDILQQKRLLEEQVQALATKAQQEEYKLQVQRFEMVLDKSLESELKGLDYDPNAFREYRGMAYDLAASMGISAEEAAARIGKVAKASLPKARRKAAEVDSATKAIASSNRTKGQQAGAQLGDKVDFLTLLDKGFLPFDL